MNEGNAEANVLAPMTPCRMPHDVPDVSLVFLGGFETQKVPFPMLPGSISPVVELQHEEAGGINIPSLFEATSYTKSFAESEQA